MYSILAFFRFYWRAVTKYQLHSPFVFDLAMAILEDARSYYAFRDIEVIREQMKRSAVVLDMTDFGTGGDGSARQVPLRQLACRAGSSPEQGQMLFRLVQHVESQQLLELGSNVGIGAMYLASAAARSARFVSLEGSEACVQVARQNLGYLNHAAPVEIIPGEFDQTLPKALKQLKNLDFVFIDGNHRLEPTQRYFEQCLAVAAQECVFVFDDMHGSADMEQAWAQIKAHPRVTLTVDFFEISLAFIHPDVREKQHFDIVRAGLKPWLFF